MDIMDIAIAKALSGGGGGGGGGASAFIVNVEVSYDEGTQSYEVVSVDKTFAQIVDAYNTNAVIMARSFNRGYDENEILYLHDIIADASEGYANFISIKGDADNTNILNISIGTLYIDPSSAEYYYGTHDF